MPMACRLSVTRTWCRMNQTSTYISVLRKDLRDLDVLDDDIRDLVDEETNALEAGSGVQTEDRLVAAHADFGGTCDQA